jgi:hypothetical protein
MIMLPRKQVAAFGRFYKTARENDDLEPKTTLLLHLAAAMALGCEP